MSLEDYIKFYREAKFNVIVSIILFVHFILPLDVYYQWIDGTILMGWSVPTLFILYFISVIILVLKTTIRLYKKEAQES